ncbi:MAG: hypothetical protein HC895_03025 [Leptolyngbyaceae cyanobacterium SM1_3_5]|nr:hypothetical protein [Leptolyngbyaceae cyanobacterium SM1_3_5]
MLNFKAVACECACECQSIETNLFPCFGSRTPSHSSGGQSKTASDFSLRATFARTSNSTPIDRALLQTASRKACANLLAIQTQLAPGDDEAQTLFSETFALLEQIQQEVNRS